MKKLHHIFLLFLLLSACTSKSQYDAMRRGLDSLNERNRSDQPFTAADVQPYVDFFDSHGTSNDQLLAYYLLGRSYHEQGEAPMALKYYQQAIECADTTDADCDFGQLSRVYGQKAELFDIQLVPKLEMEAERKAVDYAWKAKDTIAAITFYGALYLPYHKLNQFDSALFYSQNAIRMFKEIGRNDLAASLQPLNVDVLLRLGDYESAGKALLDYEEFSGLFSDDGEIQEGYELYYFYKGRYYEGVEKLDSSEWYYRKLLSSHPDLNSKEAAYNGLLSLYRRLFVIDSIAKYSFLYCQTNDSSNFIHSAEEITRMEYFYNYSSKERMLQENEERLRLYKIAIIVGIMFILVIIAYIYRAKQRHKRKIANLKQNYSKAKHELFLSQNDFEKFREQKKQEVLMLQQTVSKYADIDETKYLWNIERMVQSQPIVSQLHDHLNNRVQPTDMEWRELSKVMQQYLPSFMDRMEKARKPLNDTERLVCILTKLHFDLSDIAILLDCTPQKLTNIRSSINVKMFSEKGAKTLNANIYRL